MIMGQMAMLRNFCVSLETGPPALRQRFIRPPVASLIFLKTTASRTPLPGSPEAISFSFRARAPQKRPRTIGLPALTLAMMPFLTVSQTAGTPIRTVGLNSRMSPLQLRTDASDRVLGLP